MISPSRKWKESENNIIWYKQKKGLPEWNPVAQITDVNQSQMRHP